MNRWLALTPLIALAVVVIVGAVLLTREQTHQTISDGMVGRPAPTFQLPRLTGGEVESAEFAGRAHLVNVFASWCTPCRAEHPQLMALRANGVEIVGIAYKDHPEASQRFLTQLGDPYATVAVDRDGRYGLDLGVAGVPETFVVGPDGAIRAVHRGPLTSEAIQQTILPALRAR